MIAPPPPEPTPLLHVYLYCIGGDGTMYVVCCVALVVSHCVGAVT